MLNSKRACERKVKYTRGAARKEARKRAKEGGVEGVIYLCDNCNYWHLSKEKFMPYRKPRKDIIRWKREEN